MTLSAVVAQFPIVKLSEIYREETNMSERVSWIEHKGVRILYVDYSGLSEEEYIEVIEEFKNELLRQPPGSVATLTNVTDSTVVNTDIILYQKHRECVIDVCSQQLW